MSQLTLVIILISFICGVFVVSFGGIAALTICLLIFAVFVLIDPSIGLFIVLIVFPFFVGYGEEPRPVEIGFAILFGAWIVSWAAHLLIKRTKNLSVTQHPMFLPSVSLAAVLFISAPIGFKNGASYTDVFRDLGQYIGYLILFPVAGLVKDHKTAWKLFIIITLIGIPFYLWSNYAWWERKFDPLLYKDILVAPVGSSYLGPAIGALWPLLLINRRHRIRLLSALALATLLIFSLASGYRSRLLAFVAMNVVAFCGVWLTSPGKKKLHAAFPLFIGFLFIFYVLGSINGDLPLPGGEKTRQFYISLGSRDSLLDDTSLYSRRLEAEASFALFRKNPIIGQGTGHRMERREWNNKWVQTSFQHHVGYTEILMKFGTIGALVFLWYFWSIIRLAYSISKTKNDDKLRVIALGVLIWVITNLATAVAGSPFSDRGFAFIIGLMGGILPAFAGTNSYAIKETISPS
jgi:hypothetical protein